MRRRFEVRLGTEVAGLAEYVDKGGRRFFVHTEIANEHEGELHVSRSERLGGASFELWLPLEGPANEPRTGG